MVLRLVGGWAPRRTEKTYINAGKKDEETGFPSKM